MKHLSWFLGPKGENSEFLIDSMTTILQDYIHWRRNYFPSDSILIDKKIQRENEIEYDNIHLGLMDMVAKLRRNFPFYSPRYIGHMLSDVSIPAILGYVAGMLHNSNNCTPEAAPVTVEWEIEACNNILEMLGFTPPPAPPLKDAKPDEWKKYKNKLKEEFGWAHITSGGTVANIEALWVSRIIKYYPLAIRDVAIKEELDIEIKLPRHTESSPAIIDIKQIDKRELLFIKPNESIYLFSRFINALRKKRDITVAEANKISSELLKQSEYSLSKNMGQIFTEFPPVVFCSGTAHYSIKKAADLLGIGSSNAVLVNMDSNFRLDLKDLEKKINSAISSNKIPLAIIAIAGTTEEGAVDPIDKIVDLRTKYEQQNKSFWLHIDSAWGGYVSSMFKLDDEDESNIILNKIYLKIFNKKIDNLEIKEKIDLIIHDSLERITDETEHYRICKRKIEDIKVKYKEGHIDAKFFINHFKRICSDYQSIFGQFNKDYFTLTIEDRSDLMSDFVSDKINFSLNNDRREKTIKWGGKPLVNSFLAFKLADSITIDPHKLGYVPYPCGVIAFRNDRVRHFIMQRAPYITSSEHNALLHNPPQHIENIDFSKDEFSYQDYRVAIDAFAPFILEGSKPGASASALWFASKMIPLNRKNHGTIIKESIIAARELHEWIFTWKKIYEDSGISGDLQYEFKTFCSIPDTNVFVFVLKRNSDSTLRGMNTLINEVYKRFSIQVEQGSKKHSYSQSFFLSKTTMDEEHYKYDVFKELFEKWGIRNAATEYKKNGLIVLRATVMNPYIAAIRRNTNQNLIKEFVWELHKCANESSINII
jgi:glutamate/tyrosine decarboxylase-like PLP-dependent enzyme